MRKKILLVDDNHDILDLLEIYLYSTYDITTALNGFDGLNRAKQQRPDCIITDIMMPLMDGIKFYNSLRKQEGGAAVPVICITSFVNKVSTKSLLNMGFQTVLTKPLSREAVLEAVSEALTQPKGGQPQ